MGKDIWVSMWTGTAHDSKVISLSRQSVRPLTSKSKVRSWAGLFPGAVLQLEFLFLELDRVFLLTPPGSFLDRLRPVSFKKASGSLELDRVFLLTPPGSFLDRLRPVSFKKASGSLELDRVFLLTPPGSFLDLLRPVSFKKASGSLELDRFTPLGTSFKL